MTTGHWLIVTITPHHPLTDIPLTPTKLSSSITITSIQVAHVIVMMSLGTTTGHLVQVMMRMMTVHGPVTPVRLLELSQYCGVAVVVEGLGVGQSGR